MSQYILCSNQQWLKIASLIVATVVTSVIHLCLEKMYFASFHFVCLYLFDTLDLMALVAFVWQVPFTCAKMFYHVLSNIL